MIEKLTSQNLKKISDLENLISKDEIHIYIDKANEFNKVKNSLVQLFEKMNSG